VRPIVSHQWGLLSVLQGGLEEKSPGKGKKLPGRNDNGGVILLRALQKRACALDYDKEKVRQTRNGLKERGQRNVKRYRIFFMFVLGCFFGVCCLFKLLGLLFLGVLLFFRRIGLIMWRWVWWKLVIKVGEE